MSSTSPLDTIVALATPPGAGALAVVRLSGPDALLLGGSVFRGSQELSALRGYEATHGWLVGREGLVDEVVAWVYRRPRSYTGEDLVEFTCHGGAVSARRVLETLWEAGARPAHPGEFTRRAFLNGKLDLAQAEAVSDLIGARGRRAQELALAQLAGGLSHRVHRLSAQVRDALVRIEAHIDFGEEVPEAPDAPALALTLQETERELRRLAEGHAPSRRAREGMILAFTGRPNVGKSSLLNALLGYDRVIVHPAPGTTRDVVDVTVEWSGIPVRLVDTAGLRAGAASVERMGMERSQREITGADLVLWVVDASVPPTAEDRSIGESLDMDRVHIVRNKMDLVDGEPEGWVNGYRPRAVHSTSAITGEGVSRLHSALELELTRDVVDALEREDVWVVNARHAHELVTAGEALARAGEILRTAQPLELAGADLHRCLGALAAITGEQVGETLLDEIFSRFCVGK